MPQSQLTATALASLLLVACKANTPIVATQVTGAAVPDTTAVLTQAAVDQPGDTFHVTKLASYTFADWLAPFPYHVAVVEISDGSTQRGLAYIGNNSAQMVKFFDTGYIHPEECGGVQMSIPEVRPFYLGGRALVELVERRYYPGCMVDDGIADTLTARFFDGAHSFREVLHVRERTIRYVSSDTPESSHGSLSVSYFNADACNGPHTCTFINFRTLDADSSLGVGSFALYQWNADTTAIVRVR